MDTSPFAQLLQDLFAGRISPAEAARRSAEAREAGAGPEEIVQGMSLLGIADGQLDLAEEYVAHLLVEEARRDGLDEGDEALAAYRAVAEQLFASGLGED